MGLGLFVNAANSTALSLSTFDIGFSVSSVTPIETTFVVKVWVGASSVL